MNLTLIKKLDLYNISAYLFFMFFAVWAVIDANARILISDPAYYLFNIINSSDFFVPGTRQTAIINQVLVVLAVKLKLPLKFLIPLYSVSFVLLRLFYFFIVNNLLKNRAAGFAIIAISVVGVAQSYFRPTSESTIAMLNSILLFAWLSYTNGLNKLGKWKSLIGFLGTILLIFFGYLTHPVAVFSLLFVIIFFSITAKRLKTVYPYLAVVVTLGVFMLEVFGGEGGYNENSIYSTLLSSPLNVLSEITGYYSYKFFDSRFNELYISLAIIFLLGIIVTLIKKQWLGVIFFILFSGLYFIIACTSFKAGDSDMQMEKIFLPLVLFSSLVFSYSLIQLRGNNTILLVISIIILSLNGYIRINKVRSVYVERIEYLNEIINKARLEENKKFVIGKSQLNGLRMVFSWAMGIETLMITSMDKSIETLTVFAAPNLKDVESKMELFDNFMPAPFQTSYGQHALNPHYFKLPEQKYVLWSEDFK